MNLARKDSGGESGRKKLFKKAHSWSVGHRPRRGQKNMKSFSKLMSIAMVGVLACSLKSNTDIGKDTNLKADKIDWVETTRQLPIERFWNEFKEAVEKNDSVSISSCFSFPLSQIPYYLDKDRNGLDKSEFLEVYGQIFYPEFRSKVLSLSIKDFKMAKKNENSSDAFIQYVTINTTIYDNGDEFKQSTVLIFEEVNNEVLIRNLMISN